MLFPGDFLTVTTSLTAARAQPGLATDFVLPGSLAILFRYFDSLLAFNLRGFALARDAGGRMGEVI